jgi:3-hydroxybutyryl-CoA dehydrogenase
MDTTIDVTTIPIGVVGLGLMGCSITTCLIMAGHKVIAVAPVAIDLKHAETRIQTHLTRFKEHGLIRKELAGYLQLPFIRPVLTAHFDKSTNRLTPCSKRL